MASRVDSKRLAVAKLASSGLDEQDAKELGIRIVSSAQELQKDWPKVAALQLVYHDLDGRPLKGMYRVRMLEQAKGSFGQIDERRYLQPTDTAPAAYLPAMLDWADIADHPEIPILITEGELKAACACKHGHACIGLGGVWSWRSSRQGWGFLDDLKRIKWEQRQVTIVYDSDALTNPQVAVATSLLLQELARRGALPRIAQLPPLENFDKTGLDDFIVAEGPEALLDVLEQSTGDELSSRLWEYNGRFVAILNPGVVYDEEKRNVYNYTAFKGFVFANDFAERQVTTSDGATRLKRVAVADEWITWPLRRQLDRLTYAPGKDRYVDNQLNVWSGWGCEPKQGSVKPWEDLLDHLFAGVPRSTRDWFESWCLYPIAHPGAKLLTACGIWSYTQGIGKTLVGVTLGRVYGDNYLLIHQEELEASFNEWVPRRQFILVDDVSSYDSRSKANLFKAFITQEIAFVNEKFVPKYELPAVINYYCTSNQPNAFYLEDADRRWFIHEVTSPKKSSDWFKRYYAWLEGIGPSALLHYAQSFDFGSFDPYQPPPMTPAKAAMQSAVRTEAEAWVARLVEAPDSILRMGAEVATGDAWTAEDLVAIFETTRKGRPLSAHALGVRLSQYVPAVDVGGETYYILRNVEKWRRNEAGLRKVLTKRKVKY